MPVVLPLFIQGGKYGTPDSLGIVEEHSVLCGDFIHSSEAKTGNLAKLVGVFL